MVKPALARCVSSIWLPYLLDKAHSQCKLNQWFFKLGSLEPLWKVRGFLVSKIWSSSPSPTTADSLGSILCTGVLHKIL